MRYVYCHPFFDERKCSHRFSYCLSEVFKVNNLTLERFDYRGTGEAEGDFSHVTLSSLQDDIAKKIINQRVTLIGLRFGATLAFIYCCRQLQKVSNLILIEPILSGTAYMEYLYRKQYLKDLMTRCPNPTEEDGFRNIEGYKTSLKLIQQIEKLSLSQWSERFHVQNHLCIVRVHNSSSLQSQLGNFAESVRDKGITVIIENMRLSAFWERVPETDYSKLTKKILEWCCA
jgi:pimeloyl-ACP methyl ester carboxylesterase